MGHYSTKIDSFLRGDLRTSEAVNCPTSVPLSSGCFLYN